ncbi:hydrolase [Motiliproteus sediminis]|uniref:hydrolase n=1 Tax=Motiliproteus sediminis TaxID=1468178 RepID=UPI001AEFF2B3|nr:hydrolase [Motiliproteus sediminis]
MLIDPSRSCLLVVDIQEKLVPAIHQQAQLVDGARWLLGVASIIDIPILVSEQYPQGLGHTVEALQSWCSPDNTFSKQHFSCAADDSCLATINAAERQQIVIAGMEAHVCVLQTALGLLQQGKEVFVVADAVGSRNPEDKQRALERMARLGVQIVSREMVAFEWMQRSGTAIFKQISQEYLR